LSNIMNEDLKSVFDLIDLDVYVDKIQSRETPQSAFDAFCDAIDVFEFTFASMGRLLPSLEGDQSTKNIPRQFHLSRGAEDWIAEMVATGTLITKSPLVLYGFSFKLSLRDLVVLEMLVRVVFDRVYDLTEMPKEKKWVKISDREREVLTLVARGKTNWEVGAIMEISEYSIRDYLKN